MDIETIDFSIVKKHENLIKSSVSPNMTEVYQLCQNNITKEHFYIYEILNTEGSPVGVKSVYTFKKPDEALDQWNAFINNDVITSNHEITESEYRFPVLKKSKLK